MRDVRFVARKIGGEAQVVLHGALEQCRELRHETNLTAQLERIVAADVLAPVANRAGLAVRQAIEQTQDRGLSRAGRTRKAGRTGRYRRAELTEDGFARPSEANVLELEQHGAIIEPMPADELMPRKLEPMLATSAPRPPPGEGWGFEVKWDGVRALTFVNAGKLRISARRGADATPRYPELAALGKALNGRSAILDGEVVAFDPETGNPSFQLLQRRMGLSRPATIKQRAAELPVTYVAFDLLWLDDRSLLGEPYEARRDALAELELNGPHWQAPRHHVGDGLALFEAIHARGLEGIVAKRLSSLYRPGRRSQEWLKVRDRRGQELVIGGWMPGEGSRGGRVGSLLVGYFEGDKLAYAGGVGTGFTQESLDEITALLAPLRRDDSPFELGEDPRVKYAQRARDRGAGPVWVEPELVCQVEFTEWTHEGTLRQPSFKGLRDDKNAHEVVRES